MQRPQNPLSGFTHLEDHCTTLSKSLESKIENNAEYQFEFREGTRDDIGLIRINHLNNKFKEKCTRVIFRSIRTLIQEIEHNV